MSLRSLPAHVWMLAHLPKTRPLIDPDEISMSILNTTDSGCMVQEQPAARYKDTYTRQFAQTEARSLLKRTQPQSTVPMPETICLVAVVQATETEEGRGHVAGTLDIRPPASAGGVHPEGVPGSSHSSEVVSHQIAVLLLIHKLHCHSPCL